MIFDLQPIEFAGIDRTAPLVIAGPCSAESRGQVMAAAEGVAAAGVRIFRAGVWKPRTRPGCFEGIGEPALEWITEAAAANGLYSATEVATSAHVDAAVAAGIDVLWIGARTSANPFAVQDVADAICRSGQAGTMTVLVKNPVNPDLELWIGALQRIYNAGVRRLGGIHRGFTSYGDHSVYRNEPLWRVPIELHRRYPALPIICDPSHMGGRRNLIEPIATQAYDIGFDGLMIETHCQPECALSDKEQQVTPEELKEILDRLVVNKCSQSSESLDDMRRRIDEADEELVEVLSRRLTIAREIGRYKSEHAMAVVQPERYNDLMQRRVQQAIDMGIGEECIRTVLAAIHEESVRQQLSLRR